ncbi:hypothetical protein ACFY2Y_16635 [Janibacter hoylei]|uniref:hypothetical protein n=1 Tax=Janibacter hoylei TaxID=364298 RepID=UPI00368FBFCB
MIDVRMPTPAGPRLVEALLIAGGMVPRPDDPADRQAYLDLAAEIGDGLDAAARTRRTSHQGNVAAAAAAGDTTKLSQEATR